MQDCKWKAVGCRKVNSSVHWWRRECQITGRKLLTILEIHRKPTSSRYSKGTSLSKQIIPSTGDECERGVFSIDYTGTSHKGFHSWTGIFHGVVLRLTDVVTRGPPPDWRIWSLDAACHPDVVTGDWPETDRCGHQRCAIRLTNVVTRGPPSDWLM